VDANYRFDSEEHDDGQHKKNEVSDAKCQVEDVHGLLGAESAASGTRVN